MQPVLRSSAVRLAALMLIPALDLSRPKTEYASAQQPAPAPSAPTDPALAKVNGHAIHARHVQAEIDRALGNQQTRLGAELQERLSAATLTLLIDRCVVLDALRRDKQAARDADVQRELDGAQANLERIKKAVDANSPKGAKSSTTAQTKADAQAASDLRDDIAWRLSWQRYCDAELTEKALTSYFERYRRDYDGTQLRVSHILLIPDAADGNKAANARTIAATVQQAVNLRGRIVAKELTFAAAAGEFSQAPSKAVGGDIGLITRHGEQHEAFASAAFALGQNEISPPTITSHGVHLIQCTEVKPGDKQLKDVLPAVREAAAKALFRTTADRERSKAQIEILAAVAESKPGDRRP